MQITKEKLEKLYHSEKKTSREIAKIYGCNPHTILKKLKKWNIRVLHTWDRQIETIRLTMEQKDAVIGMMLGDASIRSTKYNSSLYMSHSAEQRQYMEWKRKLLLPLSGEERSYINKTYGSTVYRFSTWFHPDFNYFRSLFYKNYHGTGDKVIKEEAVRKLTPLGLAIWIMDDGCALKSYRKIGGKRSLLNIGVRLAVGKYHGRPAILMIQDVLMEKFGLQTHLYESDPSVFEVRFIKSETRKLMDLISKHIPDCMKYKFPSSETLRETRHHNEGVKTKSELHSDVQRQPEMTARPIQGLQQN